MKRSSFKTKKKGKEVMKGDDGCSVDSWRLRCDCRIGVADVSFQHEVDVREGRSLPAAGSGKAKAMKETSRTDSLCAALFIYPLYY